MPHYVVSGLGLHWLPLTLVTIGKVFVFKKEMWEEISDNRSSYTQVRYWVAELSIVK